MQNPEKDESQCKTTAKKYGYPPDMQKLATENILKQAEMICRDAGVSAA